MPDGGVIVFGDSLGVMTARTGGLQSFAIGGKPSAWILNSIRKAASENSASGHDVILSTGASNDAMNIVVSWLKRNGREGTTITPEDIRQIKDSREYKAFLKNAAGQIDTLMNSGAKGVYVIGVGSGPENVRNYLEHKTVGYAQGGLYSMLGINDDLAEVVSDYQKNHPDMASRVGFGGAVTDTANDRIHPNGTGSRKIVADAKTWFQSLSSGVPYNNDDQSTAPVKSGSEDRKAPVVPVTGSFKNAAGSGEVLFASNSSRLTAEQEKSLKSYFSEVLRGAQSKGTLSSLKVEFTGSADGTGSDKDNMRISRERLKAEEALFHQAEKETGISVASENITTHALGRQAAVNVTDQSKRCAKATFSF